jgi:hypothetical protein
MCCSCIPSRKWLGGLYLRLTVGICVRSSSVVWRAVLKLFDRTTYVSLIKSSTRNAWDGGSCLNTTGRLKDPYSYRTFLQCLFVFFVRMFFWRFPLIYIRKTTCINTPVSFAVSVPAWLWLENSRLDFVNTLLRFTETCLLLLILI